MVWDPMSHRATVDIDLLAKTSNSIANLQKIINEICAIEVIPDGLVFASETLKLTEAQLEAEYHGISAAFSAQLFTAKLPMRIDFGFSDTILPHRGTALTGSPIAFQEFFYDNPIKNDKWDAFLKDISHEAVSLKKIMIDLRIFFENML